MDSLLDIIDNETIYICCKKRKGKIDRVTLEDMGHSWF